MLTFTVNMTIAPQLATLIWECIERNHRSVAKAVSMTVPKGVTNRGGIISQRADALKADLWYMMSRNFSPEKADKRLSLQEQISHYVSASIKEFTKSFPTDDCIPVDFDCLNGSFDKDESDKLNLEVIRTVVANSNLSVFEQNIRLRELRSLVIELYLRDIELFNILYVRLANELGVDLKHPPEIDMGYIKTLKSSEMMFVFMDKIKDIPIAYVFKIFEECAGKPVKFQSRVKSLAIQGISNYNSVLSDSTFYKGVLQCGTKLATFDSKKCRLALPDFDISSVTLNNPTGVLVCRLRIEDYLDYVSYYTQVEEGVNTDFVRWFDSYYVFIYPSGVKSKLCLDSVDFMTAVKQELLANLIKGGVTGIFAMTDSYVYFTPRVKPRYDNIACTLYNGKVINMKLEVADNVAVKGRP